MKFDFIIGNPPYQEDVESSTNQAKPVYNHFALQAEKLSNEGLVLIIPSRWFSGGMGLDSFREHMINDEQIRTIVDYSNAKECFPNSSISGGVCIFVWEKNSTGPCSFTNINNGVVDTMVRPLNEFPVLVRYNAGVNVIHKVIKKGEGSLDAYVSPISPFGLSTKERGEAYKTDDSDLAVYSSKGIGYIPRIVVKKGESYIDCYNAMVSQTGAEHAGEPDKDGKYRVLTSSMKAIKPGEVCTHSYLVVGKFDNLIEASNLVKYLHTRFARFLILMAVSSIHISRSTFCFVPIQDFSSVSDIDWSASVSLIDHQLYKKYEFDDGEVEFIESLVKEMA